MPGLPNGTNGFVPNNDATNGLTIGFSRNVSKFAVNRYMEIRKVSLPVGLYWKWKSEQAARSRYADGRQWAWPRGADGPTGSDNQEMFEEAYYRTQRYAFAVTLDQTAVDLGSLPLLALENGKLAQQAMTDRTLQTLGALSAATTNAAWGLNEANVDGVGSTLNGNAAILTSGQNWSNGTSLAPNIHTSLLYAQSQIAQSTIGQVEPDQLVLVLGPDAARKMAVSPEITDYMKGSVYSLQQIRGEIPGANKTWGLPDQLYGFPIVVESTVQITSRQFAATRASNFALGTNDAYLVSRPGGLEGIEGAPAYSSLIGFFFEELTSEQMSDPDNRRVKARLTTDYQVVLTSPQSAFHFGHIVG